MLRFRRFTPQFKGADLGETGPEADVQTTLSQSPSVAQHGHEGRVMTYVGFVQSNNFAMRVVPRPRTEQRERYLPVSQNGKLAIEEGKRRALVDSGGQDADPFQRV